MLEHLRCRPYVKWRFFPVFVVVSYEIQLGTMMEAIVMPVEVRKRQSADEKTILLVSMPV